MNREERTVCFASYDPSVDSEERNVHDRFLKIYDSMKTKNIFILFDNDPSKQLSGHLSTAIDSSSCFILLITEEYMKRVESGNPDDKCKLEYNYMTKQQIGKNLVFIFMESRMRDSKMWPASLESNLEKFPCLDLSTDSDWEKKMDVLQQIINHHVRTATSSQSSLSGDDSSLGFPSHNRTALRVSTNEDSFAGPGNIGGGDEEYDLRGSFDADANGPSVGGEGGRGDGGSRSMGNNELSEIDRRERRKKRREKKTASKDKRKSTADSWSSCICESELQGHQNIVSCLASLGKNRIVSGSYDGTLMVWGSTSGGVQPSISHSHPQIQSLGGDFQLISTLQGHSGAIFALCVVDVGVVVSGGEDETLRIWEVTPSGGSCVCVLQGHSDYITDIILLNNSRIASASADGTIRVWFIGLGSFRCVSVIESNQERGGGGGGGGGGGTTTLRIGVNCLSMLDYKREQFVSVDDQGNLMLWDARNYELIYRFQTSPTREGKEDEEERRRRGGGERPLVGLTTLLKISDLSTSNIILAGSTQGKIFLFKLDERTYLESGEMREIGEEGEVIEEEVKEYEEDASISRLSSSQSIESISSFPSHSSSSSSSSMMMNHRGAIRSLIWLSSFPSQTHYFASGSEDGTIRIWDTKLLKSSTTTSPSTSTSTSTNPQGGGVGIGGGVSSISHSSKGLPFHPPPSSSSSSSLSHEDDAISVESDLTSIDTRNFDPTHPSNSSSSSSSASSSMVGVEGGCLVCVAVLEGHTDAITSLQQLSPTHLISASKDQNLRIWDLSSLPLSTPTPISTGTTGGLKSSHQIIVSKSSTLISGHTWPVMSVLQIDSNRFASASADDSIRIWRKS